MKIDSDEYIGTTISKGRTSDTAEKTKAVYIIIGTSLIMALIVILWSSLL